MGIGMYYKDAPENLYRIMTCYEPDFPASLERVLEQVEFSKRQMDVSVDKKPIPWQAATLFMLARRYAKQRVLEIGTAFGYSASVLAEACPNVPITTLNPKQEEYTQATENLAAYGNIQVVCETSDSFFTSNDSRYDFIFVDGDHTVNGVLRDCRFYERLHPGGLLFFHDYSTGSSWRPCPDVIEAVRRFGLELGKEKPDIHISDMSGVGLAGFYK